MMMAATNVLLQAKQLEVGYRNKPVLRGLSIPPLTAGKVVALIGPNGAGKSTLLRVLAGLAPYRGTLRLNACELSQLSYAQRASMIGFMPQSVPDSVDLTVTESLLGALRTAPESDGSPESVLLDHVASVLNDLRIIQLAERRFCDLSGGQRQIVSLALATVRAPKLLLLDEPTSALDPRHQLDVMALVRQQASAGRLVIMAVHDLALAARHADIIAVLHEGRMADCGPPTAVLTEHMLATVYKVRANVTYSEHGRLHLDFEGSVHDDQGDT